MKAGRDAHATKTFPPLPGHDVVTGTETRLEWRLMDMPRPTLWNPRHPSRNTA